MSKSTEVVAVYRTELLKYTHVEAFLNEGSLDDWTFVPPMRGVNRTGTYVQVLLRRDASRAEAVAWAASRGARRPSISAIELAASKANAAQAAEE